MFKYPSSQGLQPSNLTFTLVIIKIHIKSLNACIQFKFVVRLNKAPSIVWGCDISWESGTEFENLLMFTAFLLSSTNKALSCRIFPSIKLWLILMKYRLVVTPLPDAKTVLFADDTNIIFHNIEKNCLQVKINETLIKLEQQIMALS